MDIVLEIEKDFSSYIEVFCKNFNCKKEELVIIKKIDKCIVQLRNEYYEIISNDEYMTSLHDKVSSEHLASKITPKEIVDAFGDSPDVFSNDKEYSNFKKEFKKLKPSKDELRVFNLIIFSYEKLKPDRKNFWKSIYNLDKKLSDKNNVVWNLYGKCVVAIFNADKNFKNEAIYYMTEEKYPLGTNYFIEEESDEAFLIKKIKFNSKNIIMRRILLEKYKKN